MRQFKLKKALQIASPGDVFQTVPPKTETFASETVEVFFSLRDGESFATMNIDLEDVLALPALFEEI